MRKRRKLGRGVSNIVTSIFEFPKSIQETLYEDGIIAAGTYGILDGVYKFTLRTLVGVYEVATFPIPFPADYAPIVDPEFMFSPDYEYVVGGYGYEVNFLDKSSCKLKNLHFFMGVF